MPTMASRRLDAVVGISVYLQKCMTQSNGKYVWVMYDAQTPLPFLALPHIRYYVWSDRPGYGG